MSTKYTYCKIKMLQKAESEIPDSWRRPYPDKIVKAKWSTLIMKIPTPKCFPFPNTDIFAVPQIVEFLANHANAMQNSI